MLEEDDDDNEYDDDDEEEDNMELVKLRLVCYSGDKIWFQKPWPIT